MKYLKAEKILPKEIIDIIQQFVDGEYVYIPRKDGEKRSWGEKSGTRDCLRQRNHEIYVKYITGTSVGNLSDTYYLSEQSIRRIISQERTERSA